MKIVCDNCATKYSIADEKVRGKVFKIRCKKCSHVIVVRGGESAAPAPDASLPSVDLGAGLGMDSDEATSVATPGSSPGDSVWHLVIDREQVGPMTAVEVRAKFSAGAVDAETYAWREGFGDWLRLASIDEFKDLGNARPAAAATEAAHTNGAEEGATRRTDSADLFAQHQAAASHDEGGGGDLFGSAGATRAESAPVDSSPFAAAAVAAAATPAAGEDPFAVPAARPSGGDLGFSAASAGADSSAGDAGGDSNGSAKLTGQRNENSLLFSLNNLQALASKGPSPSPASSSSSKGGDAPAPKPGYANSSTEGSGLIDIRAMAAQTLSSAPQPSSSDHAPDMPGLAPPPVFSPVVAAPILMPTAGGGMPKWVWGVIAGGGLAVVAIAVLLVVVLTRKPDVPQFAYQPPPSLPLGAVGAGTPGAPTAGTPGQPVAAAPAAGTPAAPAAGTPAAPTEAAKPEEHKGGHPSAHVAGKHEKGGSTSAAPTATASTPAPSTPEPAAPVSKPKKGANSGDKTLDDLLNDAAPDSKPKRAASSAPAADDPNLPEQLSTSDVKGGMGAVQGRAKACYQTFHVPGTALVQIVIGKNGRVSSAETMGALAGTPTGDCVAKAVKSASFPKFKGQPMSVRYPFILP